MKITIVFSHHSKKNTNNFRVCVCLKEPNGSSWTSVKINQPTKTITKIQFGKE